MFFYTYVGGVTSMTELQEQLKYEHSRLNKSQYLHMYTCHTY